MTDVATADTQPEMPAEAERKPVPPPESSEAVKAPHPEPALLPTAIFAPETGHNIIVLESVREQAEQNLTHYLAPKLVASLKARGQSEAMIIKLFEGAHVSFFGELGQNGKTDVKISVTGPNIGPNESLVSELMIEALHEHPLYAELFAREHLAHVQKVPGHEHAMIEMHIPQLETAEYAQLVQAMAALNMAAPHAGDPPQPAKKDIPGAETAAHGEGCACEHCHASVAANDNKVAEEAVAAVEPAPVPEPAPTPMTEQKPSPLLTEVADHQQIAKVNALG